MWPWALLVGWLLVAAGQLWSLQVEAVQRGEICSVESPRVSWAGVRP